MPDTRPSFEQFADAARLALARGDRESARGSLTAAMSGAGVEGMIERESCESLLRLGGLYQDAGLEAEAERLFRDAVSIAERTGAEDRPELAAALFALGTRLVAQGANDEAESLLRRALAISERQFGADHTDLNGILNVLSRLYLKRGSFASAEPLLERLLLLKRAKGEDHPEVATVLASLAVVRQGMGDHEGAEQLGRRVLQIREKTLAPNHYAIASALELLGDECAARGKVDEAGRLYQRALSIREQTLGFNHASLRALRERIVDLQLQSSDSAPSESFAASSSSPSFIQRAPAPEPMSPVPLPVSAVRSLPATLAIAARPEMQLAPPVRADGGYALERDDHDEQRQQVLVLPGSTGLLSLQEELQNIEAEANTAASLSRAARFRATLSMLSSALSTRRGQAGVAATTVVVLLLAALSTQPRAAENSVSGASPVTGRRSASLTDAEPAARGLVHSSDSAVSVIRTAAVEVPLATASAPAASREPSRESASHAQREGVQKSADAPSLELSRNLRLPAATVSLGRADSIARVSDQAPKTGDGFSKQFWTSGIDKRAGESTGPTSAQLIGTMPEPAYPVFLRKNNVEGEVVVQFVVDETGKPDMSTLEVVRSPHDAMTASVRKVIEQLRFEPARTGGTTPKPRTEVVRSSFLFKAGGK